jgi:hypothetical protein
MIMRRMLLPLCLTLGCAATPKPVVVDPPRPPARPRTHLEFIANPLLTSALAGHAFPYKEGLRVTAKAECVPLNGETGKMGGKVLDDQLVHGGAVAFDWPAACAEARELEVSVDVTADFTRCVSLSMAFPSLRAQPDQKIIIPLTCDPPLTSLTQAP